MKEHLNKIYNIISTMRVSGNNQELAVAAKNEIRAAFRELEQKEDTDDGGQSNQ